VPEAAVKALTGIELWIVDALLVPAASEPLSPRLDAPLDRPHPPEARDPHHMHSDLDYAKLRAKAAAQCRAGV